ncbi:MAG: DUF1772 domain-containing protein [Planctomycetes bacterium]|nr:DUF1772 domain-containing protein [Planctomycetota bacterium]MCA8936236.1 DUF1772 domain-containing protein [Planctomycetota bacterium]MCA8944793.1 DUF1772 domain-containing protein [Planctomycetota bacterium]
MNELWLTAATLACAIGSALVAGMFYAFSTFIMNALRRLPTAGGIAAMQQINITVITPWFMGAFFGTAVLCLVLGAAALLDWKGTTSILLLSGSGLYLIGTIAVTIAFNVPRNDALAAVEAGDAAATNLWSTYLSEWTIWNHVRTAAAIAATLSLLGAFAI